MSRKSCLIFLVGCSCIVFADSIIIDHDCTDLTQIPQDAIQQAKSTLHIAYGHTSHGSQLTTGMSGLVDFMNGLGYPTDLYAWSYGGDPAALDLHDYAMGGDVGYYPDWVNNTRNYLGTPDPVTGRGTTHPQTNVIIWSWCGQVSGRIEQTMIDTYLAPMTQLELDYPGIKFVYMTGHLDGTGADGNLNIRNQQIRDYCIANDKILYDFADIESYDPNGLVNYMLLLCNDNCDYDSDANGTRDRNWATDWQNSHTENVDWYTCSSAHSQPLNANRKAYAAWWLWARLAGWMQCIESPSNLTADYNDTTGLATLNWTDNSSDPQENAFIICKQIDSNSWDPNYAVVGPNETTFSEVLTADGTYRYRIVAWLDNDGNECTSGPSNTATIVLSSSPPIAPSGLAAELISDDILLTWSDNSDNEQVFVFERRIDEGSFTVLYDTIPADSESYTDENLAVEHTYYYRIFARNTNGDSGYSNTVSQYIPYAQYSIRLESTSEVEDSFLFVSEPNTNYGSNAYPPRDIERYIFKFNFPTELEYKRILSADLSFYMWSQDIIADNQYMGLYRVSGDWIENSVTWNESQTGQSWATPGGDYDTLIALVPLDANTPDHAYLDPPIDITDVVQDWVRNKVNSYGLILINESLNSTNLKASEYSSGHTRLDITYTDGCPCDFSADIDYDCAVNFIDLAEMGYYWKTSEPCVDIAPVSGDGIIDTNDLSEFSSQWLQICP
ncbi:MAG: DNRLRE domain-containing protein [Phycisphaerales bacterium]